MKWNRVSILHKPDRPLNKARADMSCPTLFFAKLLATQLWSDTEMKSWGGVSLDPGSGGHWFENRALGWKTCSGGITHTPKRRWDTMRNHSSFTFRPSARHGACSLCATWLNSVPSATTKALRFNHRDQTWAKTMRWRAKEQTRINSPFSQDHTHTRVQKI